MSDFGPFEKDPQQAIANMFMAEFNDLIEQAWQSSQMDVGGFTQSPQGDPPDAFAVTSSELARAVVACSKAYILLRFCQQTLKEKYNESE